MRAQLAGLLAHEHAPLALAQQASGVRRPGAAVHRACSTTGTASLAAGRRRHAGRRAGHRRCLPAEPTNYPLAVSVDDTGDRVRPSPTQVAAPGDPAQVCALLHTALVSLVTALEHAPATPLRQVQVLGEAERAQVLTGLERHRGCQVPAGDGAGAVRGAGGARARMRWRWPAGSVSCQLRGAGCAGGAAGAGAAGRLGRGRRRWWRWCLERSAGAGGGDAGGAEGGGGVPAGGSGVPGGADRRSCWPTRAPAVVVSRGGRLAGLPAWRGAGGGGWMTRLVAGGAGGGGWPVRRPGGGGGGRRSWRT